MTDKSPLDRLKSVLGYQSTPKQNNAPQTPPSPAIEALATDISEIVTEQEAYETGLQTVAQVAAASVNPVPPIFADVETLLNSKGLTLQVSQVVVTNVVVIKQSPTETRSISLSFDGELTQENADEVRRRACMELQ